MDDSELSPELEAIFEEVTGSGLYLPESFWDERPLLGDIKAAAHARQRSADALLHVVLARTAAIIPHTIRIPAIVGADASLCYFALLCDLSGSGKTSVNAIGATLQPTREDVIDQLPLGTGEGLIEVLFEKVKEPDPKDPDRKIEVKRQTRNNVFVYVDEGEAVTVLGSRHGSTLLSTLRTLWTGSTAGTANASEDKRRILPAGTYTYGLVVAVQPKGAELLLKDAHAGTPQRFMWVLASHPDIPEATGETSGALDWRYPDAHALQPIEDRGAYTRHYLRVADSIAAEIRHHDLIRARGEYRGDPLDSHTQLLRLKTAALLAILDNRVDIRPDDWALADQVMRASENVRAHVIGQVGALRRNDETATTDRLARRQVGIDTQLHEARQRRRVGELAAVVARACWSQGDMSAGQARRALKATDRRTFEPVLAQAADEHWVEVYDSERGRRVRPGRIKPPT